LADVKTDAQFWYFLLGCAHDTEGNILQLNQIVLAVFVGKGISNVGKAVQNY
jgi:hypothetical protein